MTRDMMSSGKRTRKEQNGEIIVSAAMELFQAYGFKKVSMNEVADKSGMSIGTIYNHFLDKDQLVLEVVKRQCHMLYDWFRTIITGDMPFDKKLDAIIYGKVNAAQEYRGEIIGKAMESSPEIRTFVEKFINREIKQNYIELFKEGRKQGFIDPSLSRKTFILYVEVFKRGILASADLFTGANNRKTLKELNIMMFYGFGGKK